MAPHLVRISLVALSCLLAGGVALADDGWLGVQLQDLTPDLAKTLDVDQDAGVLVGEVVADSPADKAGLRDGDVIVSFDGQAVSEAKDLTKAVRKTDPGEQVVVTVLRDGKKRDLDVTLGERDADTPLRKREVIVMSPDQSSGAFLGISMQDLTDQLGEVFGVEDGRGVLVSEVHPDTPAATAGLQAGDVIVKVDDTEIADASDLSAALGDREPGDEVPLTIVRKGDRQTLTVTLAERPDDVWRITPRGNLPLRMREFMPRGEDLQHLHDAWRLAAPRAADEDLQSLREELRNLREELDALREELKQR